MSQVKKLYLSRNDKKIAGVCGGIGEYFEVDATMVRLAWVVLTVMTGVFPGLLGYVIAALVIPQEPIDRSHKKTVRNESDQ